MKKFISLVAILAAIFTVTAYANPGNNPNKNPGSPEVKVEGVTVTVTGGGNNLVIKAIENATGASVVVPRAGNGTFSQTFEVFGYKVAIMVQGNSLKSVTILEEPAAAHVCEFKLVETTSATCLADGFDTYVCTCGEKYDEPGEPALGHSFGEWEVVVPATCTEDGEERRDCVRIEDCGCYETDTIAALGHEYSSEVTIEPDTGKKGKGEITCTCVNPGCGDTHTHEIPALNNNGNGNDNGTGDLNYACSTSANDPRNGICWHCIQEFGINCSGL